MGKQKKKDPAKKAALQAKKDAKADKAKLKRAKKEQAKNSAGGGEEEDAVLLLPDNNTSLDDLLQAYRHRDLQGTKPIVETLEGFPPPRGNFTMTVVEQDAGAGASSKGQQEVYLFGGEYFDGVETIVVDHLLKWTYTSKKGVVKHEWKQISMPASVECPAARCAHSCVYWNGGLWVFGGEFYLNDHYHHYKDLWNYNLQTQVWREIKKQGQASTPTPRSGHAALVWKHYMIIFGGFMETKDQSPKWFNDVYVFNLKTEQWLNIPSYSKLGQKPEPRSACNIGLLGDSNDTNDKAVIHGGFSKLSSTSSTQTNGGRETKVHTDAWILHLKPILQEKPPTWERLLSSTNISTQPHNPRNPNGRCACASVTYKKCNKLLVFGGVVDSELMHHKVDSIFFSDLFCLDYSGANNNNKAKWYPLKVKKKQQQQATAVEAEEEEKEEDDDGGDMELDQEEEEDAGDETEKPPQGWDINQLRENMFAFTDGAGNLVYEKFDDKDEKKDDDDSSDEEEETKEEEKEEAEEPKQSKKDNKKKVQMDDKDSKIITSSSVMTMNPKTNTPQPVARQEPLPRIKCGAIVNKDTLYIYGGLVEIGDREVTLDDMWCIDLKKRTQWICLYEGTMHKQVWRGAIHDDDDSYVSNNDNSTNAGGGDDSDDDEDDEAKEESKTEAEQEDPELMELIQQYDLNNTLRTPHAAGEVLADFYARTKSYWNEQASEVLAAGAAADADPPTNKELKREGFQLAKKRYEELEPILDRFKELSVGSNSGGGSEDKQKSKDKKKSKKKKK